MFPPGAAAARPCPATGRIEVAFQGLLKQMPPFTLHPPLFPCYGKYGFTGMHPYPFLIQSLQLLAGCKNGSLEWLQQSYVNYHLALYENFPSSLGVNFLGLQSSPLTLVACSLLSRKTDALKTSFSELTLKIQ